MAPRSRRAMHEAVFEAGWAAERLMPRHREVLAPWHRGRGREVISLDWTYAHHERGLHIWGVKKAWDPVHKRQAPYQTVMTAVIANRDRLDGIEAIVQRPGRQEEELGGCPTFYTWRVDSSSAAHEAGRHPCRPRCQVPCVF
jgi:hypothetical protein